MDTVLTRHEAASVDGHRLVWWRGGCPSGHAVLLLHGFGMDHTVWAGVANDPTLAARCDLLMPDLRGHGASVRGAEPASYTEGRLWAADVDTILRIAGVDRVTVVAWSFGGRAVLDYVRHHGAACLSGLQMVAAASLAHGPAIGPQHVLLDGLCEDDAQVRDAAARLLVSEVLGALPGTRAHEDGMALLRRGSATERRWMRSRRLDYDDLVAGLRLPLMWVQGARDALVLPALGAAFLRVQPDTRLSLYEHAGHAPFLDDPRRFCRELIDFVETVNAAPSTSG